LNVFARLRQLDRRTKLEAARYAGAYNSAGRRAATSFAIENSLKVGILGSGDGRHRSKTEQLKKL
jgi:dsRNA-specific ribonuclease